MEEHYTSCWCQHCIVWLSVACIRPSGSSDVFYVDSGTDEMSAALSETTVESTHPGMKLQLVLSITLLFMFTA